MARLPVASKPLAALVGCLLLLGAGAQVWIVHELRYDLPGYLRLGKSR